MDAGLAAIWEETRGDPRIRIAVLDGPIDRTHPCLRDALLSEVPTLAPSTADDGPASQHGTHVASIIFGKTLGSFAGIAPACSGLILPVFASGPSNSLVLCSQLDLARAILQAVDRGAQIINISGGQLSRSGEPEPVLANAIQACADRNVLIVAAAGNDGCECLHVPAAAASALPVGAMNAHGEPLSVSNWGRSYRSQGLLAPGERILGAVPHGGLATKSGTSFAAPLVSGLAALLLSLQLKRGWAPNPHGVRDALIASAVPCDSNIENGRCLAGRWNPAGAMNLILEGGATMSEAIVDKADEAPSLAPIQSPERESATSLDLTSRASEPTIIASEALALTPATASPAAAQPTGRVAPARPSGIKPSDCGCGGGANCSCGGAGTPAQLVYALGKLGYDFGTEARRDSFAQAMPGAQANPHDAAQMAEYLRANPFEAESLFWTLNLDATPIYAVVPTGPFAAATHERLREAFAGQLQRGVELVSIPGIVAGNVTLMSGQVVPAIVPAVRGIFSWATQPLIENIVGARPTAGAERDAYDRRVSGLNSFLNRVYYDLRNLGVTAEERALNFSASNAFQVAQVMESATEGNLELDAINVRKSPVCRPDSDCYDVEIGFFDPRNVNVANKIYRFTVDVSDVIPVSIGEVRAWSRRA
ncbi:MAG: PatA/PatG family cyanobactin maturation protease [Alphaproteobacteria bacterium]|nr:PatA/PatG family cyanobactin maturation protease [Alphaproteobacteria bacterium]